MFMRVKNTSKYPIDLVRSVIKFARPSGISNFDVIVKDRPKSFSGRAWGRFRILVKISKGAIKYPVKTYYKPGKGYIQYTLYSDTESLVHVIAHELRHLWQKSHKYGRVWGSKGVSSERDADAYSIRKVREYRRTGLTIQRSIENEAA